MKCCAYGVDGQVGAAQLALERARRLSATKLAAGCHVSTGRGRPIGEVQGNEIATAE
jgi:hypothetical protein